METPAEERLEIRRQNEEADRTKKLEDEKRQLYFEEFKAESESFTEQDYIARLNEVFAKLPWYKLRYSYFFINGKLNYDAKGGALV